MGPPLSRTPWSAEFVAQELEILPLCVRDGELAWLKPVHADSLRVRLPAGARPGDFVVSVATWYPLRPLVVHSTSWRYIEGSVVLTYVLVCEPPERLPRGSLDFHTVGRAELARGDATAPPTSIGVEAVLEHALRHLAWLLKDDAAIAEALPSWVDLLRAYPPEPFRAL